MSMDTSINTKGQTSTVNRILASGSASRFIPSKDFYQYLARLNGPKDLPSL